MFSPGTIADLAADLETKSPQEILAWAAEQFDGGMALSSSFQTQSMPLLHMARAILPGIPILFIDTGYHFWETLMFRERLAEEWQLNIIDLYRDPRWDVFMRQNARSLPLEDPNLCCYLNKVQPMQKAMTGHKVWISGIRRDQTAVRARAAILELQEDGLLKINPLLNWTRADVRRYAEENDLPRHPLEEKGYRSVGCAPCTVAVGVDEDERAGRWAGRGKLECGLHTALFERKDIAAAREAFRADAGELK